MQSFITYLLFVAVAIGSTMAAQDYCDKSLCYWGTHIACGHNNRFASTCPKDAAMVTITQSLKDLIVNAFNEKRNFIAGGGHAKHQPACRMGTMQWNDELAKLAELNVKQCKMNHDQCHNTKTFSASGQNLGWMTFYDNPDDVKMLKDTVQMWYDEVEHSNMNIIKKYPRNYSGPVIGHFSVMMSDRNIAVGCAASTYSLSGEDSKAYLVACNMAYTNMLDAPIYKSCSKAGTECQSGKNTKYPNLCNTSEKY